MIAPRIFASIVLCTVSLGAADAADTDRYALERSGDHFVRMDRQTGELTLCRDENGSLTCKSATDDRADAEREIQRLQSALAALDGRVTKLENSVSTKIESALPSEEEFQRSMGYMQQFLRNFMGVVKELDEEAKPSPNRT